jgi:hypothetical protein
MDTPEQRLSALQLAFEALLRHQPRDVLEGALGYCETEKEHASDQKEEATASAAALYFHAAIGVYEEGDEMMGVDLLVWHFPDEPIPQLPPGSGASADFIIGKYLLAERSRETLMALANFFENDLRFIRLVPDLRRRSAIVAEIRARAQAYDPEAD